MMNSQELINSCRGMTKKQLMRRLQAEFHSRKWGRLYRKLSRKRKHIMFKRDGVMSMIYLMQFKVGDIVHDYSSNHRITKIPPPEKRTCARWFGGEYKTSASNNGWWKNEMDQFEYGKGCMSCGCGWHPDPAKTREELERDMIAWTDAEDSYFANDERYIKWAAVINSGGHVLNEDGILLEGM